MSIQVLPNPNRGQRGAAAVPMLDLLWPETLACVAAIHRSIDGYAPTPLVIILETAVGRARPCRDRRARQG